jgi:hypothetical protein
MRLPVTTRPLLLVAIFLGFMAVKAIATTYYVDVNSANPTPPYTSWATASTDIQSAINVSTIGDVIMVTNGVYQTGGQTVAVTGTTNRVAITQAVTVQSVNGPAMTMIEGYQVPLTINSNNAVRCVYITNNAALIGFTLTNGATQNGSGLGGGVYCQSSACIISNCVIVGNAAYTGGGGTYQGTLLNCSIMNNLVLAVFNVPFGGGADNSYLINCTISGNSISTLNLSGGVGGGAYESHLANCMVINNFANPKGSSGGGTANCYLTNCVIANNSVNYAGGGVSGGSAVNCNIVGNSAYTGGGAASATLTNCIVYYNYASSSISGDTNYTGGPLAYCCTTPLPFGTANPSNITSAPLLVGISDIATNSPCRGAGATVTSGMDINGNPWANPPSIGCEEPYPASLSGNLNVSINAPWTNNPVGYPLTLQANISGPAYSCIWNLGNGIMVTNAGYISPSWPTLGVYPVTLTAYNGSYPTGETATLLVNVYQPTNFYVVSSMNQNPIAPYDSWAKAATNIQSAVNAAIPGGLILVSDGLYNFGSTKSSDGGTNRVAITQPVNVQSVNGLAATIINGTNQFRCVYVTNGAVLSGFTLTSGYAANGGGVYAASASGVITNCIITHCIGGDGGGASFGTFYNCLITGNGATYGGGVAGGIFNNCSIVSNSATYNGGGIYAGPSYPVMLANCIIESNSATSEDGGGVYNMPSAFAPYYNCLTNCILTNCTLTFNIASRFGSAAYAAQLNNCIINSNRVPSGGYPSAVEGGLLNNCTLIGNQAAGADAADEFLGYSQFVILNNCTLTANMNGGAYDAILNNCILSQNSGGSGGGAYRSTLNNCLIISNASPGYLVYGGGAYYCTLTNCILAYNLATDGGGASQSTLFNCTVVANTATSGGGIFDSVAYNCILYDNSGGDYYPYTTQYPLNYCCTPLLATNGIWNITNAPLFMNFAAGDFHLQSSSPCINSGNNAYIAAATDFDGNPRIVGGTVDIGAYEYQAPTSVISYAYLQQYGLPTDGSVDFKDLDGSPYNVYQDWIAGLNPTNPASVLMMLSPTVTNSVAGVTVSWESASGIDYNLLRAAGLTSAFTTVQSNIVGQAGTTSYTDSTATNGGPYFYRVEVP